MLKVLTMSPSVSSALEKVKAQLWRAESSLQRNRDADLESLEGLRGVLRGTAVDRKVIAEKLSLLELSDVNESEAVLMIEEQLRVVKIEHSEKTQALI